MNAVCVLLVVQNEHVCTRVHATHRTLTMVFRFVTEPPIVIKLELVKMITDLKLRNVCVCICVGSRQIRATPTNAIILVTFSRSRDLHTRYS